MEISALPGQELLNNHLTSEDMPFCYVKRKKKHQPKTKILLSHIVFTFGVLVVVESQDWFNW